MLTALDQAQRSASHLQCGHRFEEKGTGTTQHVIRLCSSLFEPLQPIRLMKKGKFVALPILALVLVTGIVERLGGQSVDPVQALAALHDKILSKGPNGEQPSSASSVS